MPVFLAAAIASRASLSESRPEGSSSSSELDSSFFFLRIIFLTFSLAAFALAFIHSLTSLAFFMIDSVSMSSSARSCMPVSTSAARTCSRRVLALAVARSMPCTSSACCCTMACTSSNAAEILFGSVHGGLRPSAHSSSLLSSVMMPASIICLRAAACFSFLAASSSSFLPSSFLALSLACLPFF